uniref:Uncharacterized protein n=1 Tax=Noccaea caerulescens TaxID=107243 RepID=A0A1J3GL79_NOCCA
MHIWLIVLESTEDEFVLVVPLGKYRVRSCNPCSSDSRRWWESGSINMARKIISVQQSMDLNTPCEIVCGGKFGDVGHVDVEERLRLVTNGFCIRSHGKKRKEKKEKAEKEKKRRKRDEKEVERKI